MPGGWCSPLGMREVYVSVDVEADGPIPGPNSMLSLGAVALLEDGTIAGEFEVNLQPLEGAQGDPDTLAWWAKQPKEAWDACHVDPQPPDVAMRKFVDWVGMVSSKLSATPVCVAYPAGYDFLWVYWMMLRFGLKSPFSFSCVDIKSFAMAKLGTSYKRTTKSNMPKRWFEGLPPHTHVAKDDAKEQGLLFIRMLKEPCAKS